MHCSIVGTCLSTMELRKIIAKVTGHDLKGLSDLAIHEEAVLVAGHQGTAARLLHKALDRRYEATLKEDAGPTAYLDTAVRLVGRQEAAARATPAPLILEP